MSIYIEVVDTHQFIVFFNILVVLHLRDTIVTIHQDVGQYTAFQSQ
jgi:hypothetical protein